MLDYMKRIAASIRSRILILLQYKKNVKFGPGCRLGRNVVFEGKNRIGERSLLANCDIGIGTYIGSYAELDGVSIGRFCSIGKRLHIVAGRHPTATFVSTHPAFFSQLKQAGFSFVKENRFSEFNYADDILKRYVVIGCDVWIGDGVSILDGVHIGQGAILAAGTVVVKDVLPYSIVAGVPARAIKKRFSDSQIEYLLQLKWWDKPWEWIAARAEFFNNIDLFIASTKME